MAEKTGKPLVSEGEERLIDQSNIQEGAMHIAKGYLLTLRGSIDPELTLTKVHSEALGAILPDADDRDIYIRFHNQAFNFLRGRAKRFHLRV